ncbi:hypothetical protein ATANTOWER_022112, partial [Ataeniobius toweri]|nr:hypothetical protein [Ataeniobius toweri]
VQVALMVGKQSGEEMGEVVFPLSALMWPSFESRRSGEEEMCFASKRKRKKKGKGSIWR